MTPIRTILTLLTLTTLLSAQELPQPSPKAYLLQRVGLTDITIDYSRPSARGRAIFGQLVPYGQIWRTGANRITLITFSTDITLEGQQLRAGKYGLLTIPNPDRWTIILTTDTTLWGADGYDPKKDALRFDVTPADASEPTETFTISIDNIGENTATLTLAWENTRIPINLQVEVDNIAMANIERAIKENSRDWRVYRNSAQYFLNKNIHLDRALDYINRSIELSPDNWYSHYLRGEILARRGNFTEAINAGNTALKLGNEQAKAANRPFSYADMIQNSLREWREKAGKDRTGRRLK